MSIDPMDHVNLIHTASNKIYGNVDKEDLFQVGFIALMRAAEKFDPSLGNTFSTWAMPIIVRDMWKHAKKEQKYREQNIKLKETIEDEELTDIIDELSDKERDFIMHIINNKKYSLLKKLGIDEYQFKVRAKKILDKL